MRLLFFCGNGIFMLMEKQKKAVTGKGEPKTKKEIIEKHQKAPNDTGSPAVQIALLTERINNLTEHLKANVQDKHSRRGLMQMVSQRKALLRYMEKTDLEAYRALKKELGIR